jgi:hypothetical protein
MSAGPRPTLRDLLTAGGRPPVRGTLAAPRVPDMRVERELVTAPEFDDANTEPTRDLSPTARVVLALQDADPITASCGARLVEAYCELDADHKVLLMAVAQAFRDRCDRG